MNESLSMGTLHDARVEPSPRLSSEKTRLINQLKLSMITI
jgi:hypothetical protein